MVGVGMKIFRHAVKKIKKCVYNVCANGPYPKVMKPYKVHYINRFTCYIIVLHLLHYRAYLPIDNFMPNSFRSMYPTARCIIDATEIFIQIPSHPSAQQLTFSNYKNCNTLKALVGITPSGTVCFISKLFGGNISDKRLRSQSGLLDVLEPGDTIMADRGFNIDELLPSGVPLNMPPRLNESGQLTEGERTNTRHIASVRIHVECALKRTKNYSQCT